MKQSILPRPVLFLAAVVVGLIVSCAWLWNGDTRGLVQAHSVALPLLLLVTIGATILNITMRWGRWHFLARRFTVDLKTRDSFQVWFSTLPAIVTPFYIGELVRYVFLKNRSTVDWGLVIRIWLMERGLDALMMLSLYAAVGKQWLLLGVSGLLTLSVASLIGRRMSSMNYPISSKSTTVLLVLITAAIWVVPGFALWMIVSIFAEAPVTVLMAMEAFFGGTLLGGVTGLPGGVGVAGSTTIMLLTSHGVVSTAASLSVAVFRLGTVWFALALGMGLAIRWRSMIVDLWKPDQKDSHFDNIADDYEEQIPEHVRTRLIGRKIKLIEGYHSGTESGASRQGLDIGCGQGWYALEMGRRGFAMKGMDASAGQVSFAESNAPDDSGDVSFCQGDALNLPFEDNSFDFAYAVNVIHHITDREAQAKAFDEIIRVLRPGGTFHLHEINIENPVFRLYMGYVFPLLRLIDEGTECWIRPTRLPLVEGGAWEKRVDYFTFFPDFVPQAVLQKMEPLERWLEGSAISSWSAHYHAVLRKNPQSVDHEERDEV